jgi:hypothetical protein
MQQSLEDSCVDTWCTEVFKKRTDTGIKVMHRSAILDNVAGCSSKQHLALGQCAPEVVCISFHLLKVLLAMETLSCSRADLQKSEPALQGEQLVAPDDTSGSAACSAGQVRYRQRRKGQNVANLKDLLLKHKLKTTVAFDVFSRSDQHEHSARTGRNLSPASTRRPTLAETSSICWSCPHTHSARPGWGLSPACTRPILAET